MTSGAINSGLRFPELKCGEHQTELLKKLGVPAGEMPFIMQPVNPHYGIVFTWCHWNPFQPRGKWAPRENPSSGGTPAAHPRDAGATTFQWGGEKGYPALFDSCVGQPKWKVLVKLFGWTERIARTALGNFNPQVHILPHAQVVEWMQRKKWTSYLKADPHVSRSYFLAWHFVDQDGIGCTFDESPRIAEGEWVNSSGDAGEGAFVYGGRGVNFYKRYIREREREHGQAAYRRFGDPRAFATQAAAAEGGTSLFELFLDDGRKSPSSVVSGQLPDGDWRRSEDDLSPMYFEPAKIRQSVKLDLAAFGSLLEYDPDKPVTVENQPKHYVSDRCQNFIRSLLNYQLPEDGGPVDSANVWKDPIDAGARYGFGEPTGYFDAGASQVSGGGSMG